ncbi:MAG TPA: hypothetical protein VGR35_18970 [Tepidisphaeraceae bacterium]|nr:hypothetical protein [Tepidisphaeraceae bacterium]
MDAPATTAELRPAQSSGVRHWKLWFALLGGAIAWAGHLLLAYAMAEFGCVAGLGHRHVLGVTVISWMLLVVSALFTAMAAAALLVSYGIREKSSVGAPDPDDRSTREFVARFGLIVNALFLFVVLAQSVPVFFYWGRC